MDDFKQVKKANTVKFVRVGLLQVDYSPYGQISSENWSMGSCAAFATLAKHLS